MILSVSKDENIYQIEERSNYVLGSLTAINCWITITKTSATNYDLKLSHAYGYYFKVSSVHDSLYKTPIYTQRKRYLAIMTILKGNLNRWLVSKPYHHVLFVPTKLWLDQRSYTCFLSFEYIFYCQGVKMLSVQWVEID